MNDAQFYPGQKVTVCLFAGKLQEVKIFSFDKKYIYFVDPTVQHIPELKNELLHRRIGPDIIIIKQ